MVLEVAPMFFPHDISQLEPQLLLKLGTTLRSSEQISHSVDSVHLGPIPELFHGHILRRYHITLVYSYTLLQILLFLQNL